MRRVGRLWWLRTPETSEEDLDAAEADPIEPREYVTPDNRITKRRRARRAVPGRGLPSVRGDLVSHPRVAGSAPLLLRRWRLNDPPALGAHRRERLAA
jgi:hypothetical protein